MRSRTSKSTLQRFCSDVTMSLSNILQSIQRKGQIQKTQNETKRQNDVRPKSAPPSIERTVDPVVARLKAARKAEREQKEAEMRAKKGLVPKIAKPKPTKPANPGAKARAKPGMPGPPAVEKKPKMSFSQLMKKASSIDQSKMSISITPKSKTPDRLLSPKKREIRPREGNPRVARDARERGALRELRERRENVKQKERRDPVRLKEVEPVKLRTPIPTRKPSAKLEQRLKSRPREEEEGSDGMDSFIESDEEQASYGTYDRDEIWSMFNRGKKRSHFTQYDDDSDDMEATGAEIWAEEARSKRNALEEDRREMEEEQRLSALKKARKR